MKKVVSIILIATLLMGMASFASAVDVEPGNLYPWDVSKEFINRGNPWIGNQTDFSIDSGQIFKNDYSRFEDLGNDEILFHEFFEVFKENSWELVGMISSDPYCSMTWQEYKGPNTELCINDSLSTINVYSSPTNQTSATLEGVIYPKEIYSAMNKDTDRGPARKIKFRNGSRWIFGYFDKNIDISSNYSEYQGYMTPFTMEPQTHNKVTLPHHETGAPQEYVVIQYRNNENIYRADGSYWSWVDGSEGYIAVLEDEYSLTSTAYPDRIKCYYMWSKSSQKWYATTSANATNPAYRDRKYCYARTGLLNKNTMRDSISAFMPSSIPAKIK